MATTIITPEQNAIVSEVDVAASCERVFQALIQPDQLVRWWTNDEFKSELWELESRKGGRWRCRQRSETTEINGKKVFEVHGEVAEIDPPRLLVFTWTADWDPPGTSPSIVRWELMPNASGGTRVRVTHGNLAPQLAKDYSGGWPGVVELLKKFVEK